MAQTPPVHSRPNLQLKFTPLRRTMSAQATSQLTLLPSPFAATDYSPFRSAGLKPPTPYGGAVQFTPRVSKQQLQDRHGSRKLVRIKRYLFSRALVCVLFIAGLLCWWGKGWKEELDIVMLGANELGMSNQLFEIEVTKDLRFISAANSKIHYIGRWTATPNRLRKDGTFPGVHFDITISNTTTLLLALHNNVLEKAESSPKITAGVIVPDDLNLYPATNPRHLSFRPSSLLDRPAQPISLLAQVDQEEYVLLPNSSALVKICLNDLNPNEEHHVRIIAPMTDDHGKGMLQLEGLWLSRFGKLIGVQGTPQGLEAEEGSDRKAGEKNRAGLHSFKPGGGDNNVEEIEEYSVLSRKKILEVVTDSPGWLSGKHAGRRTGGADGLLAGVMGWEYLLGDMFNVDHVAIGIDGMCLIQDCIGGVGAPFGMGDVFFRSGPHDSLYFEHPWLFHTYVPDVLILNLGASDSISFESRGPEYNRTSWDLFENFEDSYVSLVKAIRRLAYPKHPSMAYSQKMSYSNFLSSSAPAAIPIFVMRPLRGQLEHATQGAVNRLRADGDKSVFWLDTSGWLDVTDDDTATQDFFVDDSVAPPKWRLTEQGNQRVAIFLHMHVCRYLASDDDHCAFLPPEVYQGKAFNPEEANFDRFIEDEKERKLKKLFWGNSEENVEIK